MTLFFFWVLLSTLIGAWSRSRGHGFWVAFVIAFALSPLVAACIVAVCSTRYRALRNGTTLGPAVVRPEAPRPMFCAVMIVVITLAVVLVLGR